MSISIEPENLVETMKKISLLSFFSEDDLKGILYLGKELEVEAHTNVVIQGELSWGLYIILSGVVGVFKTNKMTGVSFDLSQMREGASFGEMSLIDEGARTATVRALVNTKLFFISKDEFTKFLERSSDLKMKFYSNCLRSLIGMLKELDENYVVSQYQLWQTMLSGKRQSKQSLREK